jgi:fermentation-respiration switch protein FrsA (DUF1100 family)
MTLIQGLLMGFGILVGIVLIYVIVIVFFPIMTVPRQPLKTQTKKHDSKKNPPKFRHNVQFSVNEMNIGAWLYLPEETSQPAPCVVMSTGFGGTKDCLLEPYAVRFVEAGLAVLTYDYRHFGESEGEPRQNFDVLFQLDDFRAAIKYARSRTEIDPEKIALWSTSAAGGYGLVLAAEDERISAVISQCGAIDHKADDKILMEREGMGFFLRLIVHAQRDKGRSRFGLSPHTIPIVGLPGTLALVRAPGAFSGYSKLFQNSNTFKNEVCMRLFFMKHGENPIEASKKVQCPVLFLACEKDNLAAPDSFKRAAEALGDKAEVKTYPIEHFDIYEGEYFEKAISEMITFLEKHL